MKYDKIYRNAFQTGLASIGVSSAPRQTEEITKELDLRKKIEEFYLPKQLIDAIVESGGINQQSKETMVGIGFLDISRYTFLSRFLSPPENQIVLNGLYSAFNWVLYRHGGYLNKIEGDSLMFHYGGPIDPRVKGKNEAEAAKQIAKNLFYTCVELQRISNLFNETNKNLLSMVKNQFAVDSIVEAYRILGELRNGYGATSFNAHFQIRIRVGASLGRVLIGNFGPDGAKQWDVIGMPVIEAKRMESSAPIGGLRITNEFFEILRSTGIAQDYHHRLQREAKAIGSVYQSITFEDLFRKAVVSLKDKKDAQFITYSIQVNPALPEGIQYQSKLLLRQGEVGADAIVDFIRYYRGNHFVIAQIEDLFCEESVMIRKPALLEILLPRKYRALQSKYGDNIAAIEKNINAGYTLFDLLSSLGKIQDAVKGHGTKEEEQSLKYQRYNDWMAEVKALIHRSYNMNRNFTHQGYYFYNVIFPLFFATIKAAILEYQDLAEEVGEAC